MVGHLDAHREKELVMTKRRGVWFAAIAAVIGAAIIAAPLAAAKNRKSRVRGLLRHEGLSSVLIAFGNMYGVDGPFTNPANAIRNIVGDEDPWELDSARGFLTKDGHLVIRVEGLIFSDGRPNDEPTFRGAVSCITEDEDAGTTPIMNVITEGFPANAAGDSTIDAHITLPNPCVAPIVFVLAGSEDKWFAVTGVEVEEDEEDSPGNGNHDDNGDDDDDDQGEDDDD